MPNPFPGMNPYLENPAAWPGVHSLLISVLQRALTQVLPPGFVARPEERIYLSHGGSGYQADAIVFVTGRAPASVSITGGAVLAPPAPREVEVPEETVRTTSRQRFLEVRDQRNGGREIVAIIELLSLANKQRGRGREEYLRKQEQLLQSDTHLLEIDLLRSGEHTVYVPIEAIRPFGPWDYLVTLSDASRPDADLFWRMPLDKPLPTLLLPLTPDVAPVPLDLQAVLNRCYDESALGADIDYALEPVPALTSEQGQWADAQLRSAGLRP